MLHRITILSALTFTLGGFLIDWNANSISAADPSATTEDLPTLTGPAAAEYLRNTEGLDELYNSIATSPEGGGVYTQQQRLTASDGNTGMGLSVAISGNTAVVGARTDAGLRGSAYVFVRSGTTWTEQQKLIPSHASPEASLFGYSVAISGDTIVVGAMASLITGSTGRGSAYVFVRSGTNWTEQARLLAPDAGGEGINFQFGRSVAVDGDMAIVGANGAGPNFRGAAYVFARSAGVWAFDQRLAASDGADNDFFGYSVALAGQTVIIGSFADDDGGEASGSAYVYVRNGTWSEQQKLVPSDPIPSGHFGISVALSGETAVVGSMPLDNFIDPTQGSAYVFTRSGGTWAQAQKLQGCDIDRDLFGGSVAISGDRIVVGREVPSSTPPAMPPGNAYFFDRSGSNWTLRQRIQGGPTALYFGNGVGIASDGTAAVGSFRDTGNTDHAAYIYVEQPGTPSAPCPGGTPTPSVTPTPSPIPTPSPTPTITPTPPASPTPTPGETDYDFDGDGRADLAVFRPMPDPAANFWYISKSSDGTSYATEWGIEIDKLTTADYDGDGKADIAVWREDPSDPDRAMFYVLRSSDGQFQIEQFGRTGDVHSVVGDWDGDGKDDVAVYRVTGGQGQFFYRPSSQPGVDFVTINWGTTGDTPVRGDFDGDERSDAAVFRPSDGIWYILQSSNGQPQYRSWGTTGDKLVPADYDGDDKTDPAVFRGGTWYILKSSNGQPSYITFGTSADTLVPADYDGDGQTDVAVYRNGTWYINQTTSGFAAFNFGLGSDVPVPSAYIGP